MALDTVAKRMNAARVGRPWMRSRRAVGATTQASRIASGHGYGGNAISSSAIEDPDDDLAVTARVDSDGATIRPARVVFYHAADGAREADFTGFDRSHRLDRHHVRSSREFRNPNVGNRFDVGFDAVRAGEAFALQRLVVWVSATDARPRAAENTDRTDHEGATLGVQAFRVSVSADGEREADAETLDAFVTDRWVARFAVPSAQGLGQFWEIDLESQGRAGHAFALDRLVLWVSDAAEARPGDET